RSFDARGRARGRARYDRGRVRALPAAVGLPATDSAGADRHRARAGARRHAVGTDEPLLTVAPDVFVLRRVSPGRFVHLGGRGRGEGWAGIVEASLEDDASIAEALKSEQPVRIERDTADRIFGPYYARSAAIVPVSHDAVVVFGSPHESIGAADDTLVAAAAEVNDSLEPASPAKQLAEQLELLEAVRASVAVPPTPVDQAMEALAGVARDALSCEIGLLYLANGDRLAVAARGWTLAVSRDD